MPTITQEAEVETRDRCRGVSVVAEAQEGTAGASAWSLSSAKRIVDVLLSLAALLAALVPGGLIYILVRVTSRGPGFCRQRRVGYRGRLFTLYKFRTMEAAECADGPSLTRDADPRVTAIGKLLRKFKLDELPQFYNVLRGDMSLVGPRPKLPQYAARTDALYRPGITGFATLLFRQEEQLLRHVSPEDLDSYYERRIKPRKARADYEYMKRASFASDARILFRTFFASLIPAAGAPGKRRRNRRFAPARRTRQRRLLRAEFENK
jgi:lipopolysaccharide/colanic/teichoic acid biosynthesis glycosyltransferase